MALIPIVLALVVTGGIHSMNGIDAPYVGSCCALMPLMLALVVRARAFIP